MIHNWFHSVSDARTVKTDIPYATGSRWHLLTGLLVATSTSPSRRGWVLTALMYVSFSVSCACQTESSSNLACLGLFAMSLVKASVLSFVEVVNVLFYLVEAFRVLDEHSHTSDVRHVDQHVYQQRDFKPIQSINCAKVTDRSDLSSVLFM